MDVHQERWSFGKGWSLVRFTAHLVEPQIQPLIGFSQEWSSGTKGPVTADVVLPRKALPPPQRGREASGG